MSVAPNVDLDEIEKFSKLSHKWWDPQGMMKSLHAINPLRLHFILKRVSVVDKMVLDIGCGCGILTESLAKAGAKTVGIDLSNKVIEIATHHAKMMGLGIDYRLMSAEALAERQAGTFDVITCMEVLEHIPSPYETIRACANLLKPGGHVFFSTINRTWKAYLCAILVAERVLNLLPKGTHSYQKLLQPKELERWGRSCGLEKEDITGIRYHPFRQHFSLTSSATINYIIGFRKS